MKPASPKFISYLRVSTTRQGESGLGLEAQRTAVANHIGSVGGVLLSEFIEVESGKRAARPVLAEALAQCRRVGATLVIAKLDRLARNVAFVSSLMESRTDFCACDVPYANRLMLHILAAFAEHVRDMIAARTKAALAAAKARGVRLGTHGAVLAAERKAKAQERAENLRDHLTPLVGMPLAAIADQLNSQSVATRDGAKWTPTTVRRVLIRLRLHSQANAAPKPLPASYSPITTHPLTYP